MVRRRHSDVVHHGGRVLGVRANAPRMADRKIAAAAKAIDPEDHEEVHFLLVGAARDLAAMRCPGCGQPLVTEPWIEWSTRVDQGGKG